MKFVNASIAMFITLASSSLYANSQNDLRCLGSDDIGRPLYTANSWSLIVNFEESSSKNDILKTFSLLSGTKLRLTTIDSSDVLLGVLSLDSVNRGEKASALKTLSMLEQIPGVKVECIANRFGNPATGVHN